MNRRTCVKTLITFSIGVAVFPSCLGKETKASIELKKINISGAEEMLIESITDALIPKDQTLGAVDVGACQFVLTMMDDCYSKQDQEKFIAGLDEFKAFSKTKMTSTFEKASLKDRIQFLQFLESEPSGALNINFFYHEIKRLTIRAFTQSAYYLTEVRKYKLVPGKFNGCVPI